MIGTPRGHRTMSCELPSDRAIVAKARDMVRRTLTSWGLPDLMDDAVLMVSELVSNAIAHGAPPIRLSLRAGDGALRGEVSDHGAGRPRLLNLGRNVDHGRGLMIVEALADQWGVLPGPEPAGKSVWFVRRTEGQARGDAS
ncbi:ATP-binding protein [Sphaerisporangium sp. NPDC088356]|uniref:ATP-binding protein n=1 Tax=Sphaerisporangium sp. NPDC088356 TaxID=3154871 RepID=UPI00342AAB3D